MGDRPGTREVSIRDESIRLGQFLQIAGIADSGAEAKGFLADGEVVVDGEPESRRGRQLHVGSVVEVFGERLVVTAEG